MIGGQARSVVVRLTAETSQYVAKMREAGQVTEDTAARTQRSSQKSKGAMDALNITAGTVATTVGTAVVMSAANFEQAMSNVQAATHETAGNMAALEQAALDAGKSTAFSATEAAAGIENLAKAGVSTEDILGGGLAGALDLAAAGSLDVASAAEFTATALTQFQLEGTEATHVADLLAAGAGKAQGEVSDMALALSYAGVPAAQLGVTIEETAGTIALLAKNGVIGEKAGTSMRGMLASLTSPSKKAAEEMNRLGIEVFDAQGQFVGFEGIAGQLQSRLSGLTEEERAHALGVIFGNEQLQAANVLYREGAAGVAEWTGQVDDAGFAAETAAIKMDNLKGKFEEFTGALETTLIGQGDQYMGPFGVILDTGTAALGMLDEVQSKTDGWIGSLLGGPLTMGWRAYEDLAGGADEAAESTEDAAAAQDEMDAASRGAMAAISAETEALEVNTEALYDARDAAIDAFDAQTGYARALADAREHAKEAAGGIVLSTEAGRANRDMLSDLASAWNAQDETVKNNVARYREARRAFIDTAVEMGVTRGRARELADELMHMPKSLAIDVALRDEASAKARAIRDALAQIRDKTVTVRITQSGSVVQNNTGGYGPQGETWSSGGFTGRGGRFEPAGVVHRNEVVIPEPLVRRDWKMLQSRYGHLPGFAGGGLVGGGGWGAMAAGAMDTAAASAWAQAGAGWAALANSLAKDWLPQAIKAAENQVGAAQTMKDSAQADVDATLALMGTLGTATTAGFMSDLFGTTAGDPIWQAGARGPGFVDPVAVLQGDIAGLEERRRLQQQLADAGLDGPALDALLAQAQGPEGNQMLAGFLASGQAGQFEALFNQRSALAGTVGGEAGRFAYGDQLAAQTAVLDQSAAELREQTRYLKALERRLEKAEGEAARREERDAVRGQKNADRTGQAVAEHIHGIAADVARGRGGGR